MFWGDDSLYCHLRSSVFGEKDQPERASANDLRRIFEFELLFLYVPHRIGDLVLPFDVEEKCDRGYCQNRQDDCREEDGERHTLTSNVDGIRRARARSVSLGFAQGVIIIRHAVSRRYLQSQG